jgi:hypothetical protein
VSSMDSRDVRQGRATPDGFCRVRLNTKRRARACRTEPEKGSDARLQGSWCRGEGITATSPLVMMSGRVAATSPLWMCGGATATWSVKTQLIISLLYWGPVQTRVVACGALEVFGRSWKLASLEIQNRGALESRAPGELQTASLQHTTGRRQQRHPRARRTRKAARIPTK